MICFRPRAPGIVILSALLAHVATAAEPVPLTNDGYFRRDLVCWPGKNELVFSQSTPTNGPFEGRLRLMLMNLDDRKVEMLHKDGEAEREFAVSGDGKVYAYGSFRNITSNIVVKDLANNKTTTLKPSDHKGDWFAHRATLSPKGDRIVYVKFGDKMVARDLRKDDAKDLVLGVVGDEFPNLSPDGKRIVFSSRRDGDYEIYVMNADGTGETRLTKSPGLDVNARFSPDGGQIAFTSNRNGNYEIYVMNADGANVRRVTNHPERDDFPCWTPDGKHLYFVGERKGKFDIYKVEVPTENTKAVTGAQAIPADGAKK